MMTKRIFIAATQQNDGKTTVSLGLIYGLKKVFKNVGFIKPVGQRYLIEEGYKVDEDSVLIGQVCQMKTTLKNMSPIAVEKGFTERYIKSGKREKLVRQIEKSFQQIAKNNDLVIIEGTGHAGVGSVFDLSNAYVASLLKSKVILISSGGLGRPIDEIMLNQALFEKKNVEIMGVIINKVLPEKYKKIKDLVRKGLERKGLNVLGVIPYVPILSSPTMGQIKEETKAKVIHGVSYLDKIIKKIVIGAMEPHDALNYMEDQCLLITPGDREDIILTALCMHLTFGKCGVSVSGLILSGGMLPHPSVMSLIKKAKIAVLSVGDDTYTIASRVHDLTVKIRPQDKEKYKLVVDLVHKYVDIKKIIKNL